MRSIELPPDWERDSGRRRLAELVAVLSLFCSTFMKFAMVEKLDVGVIVVAWLGLGLTMPQDG